MMHGSSTGAIMAGSSAAEHATNSTIALILLLAVVIGGAALVMSGFSGRIVNHHESWTHQSRP